MVECYRAFIMIKRCTFQQTSYELPENKKRRVKWLVSSTLNMEKHEYGEKKNDLCGPRKKRLLSKIFSKNPDVE